MTILSLFLVFEASHLLPLFQTTASAAGGPRRGRTGGDGVHGLQLDAGRLPPGREERSSAALTAM